MAGLDVSGVNQLLLVFGEHRVGEKGESDE